MKRFTSILLILSTLLLLGSCSNNKKEELYPVSIGNLSFHYDTAIWKANKASEDAPLQLSDAKGNLMIVTVSQEGTYQHPLEMINFLETMISTYKDYQVFIEPTEIKVNDTTWYEFGYSFNDGTTTRKVYQRYYGKYYVAASMAYSSTEQNYESGIDNAMKIMSDVTAKDVANDANEADAKKFLVGEWDIANSGYLVLNEDGTYGWYKDSTKDKNNMHFGTYGGDVENVTLELKKGDGIYLVLFPEGLILDGVKEEPTSYKSDYIISFNNDGSEEYQMVNMASYNLYTITKQ